MKIIVIGAGIQGRGCAWDLVRSHGVTEIILADRSSTQMSMACEWLSSPKVSTRVVDATDCDAVSKAVAGCDAIVNAAPYEHILSVTRAAIAAGVSVVDLGGDTQVVLEQMKLDRMAREKGITVVPDCGVGPGITNIMVGHGMEHMDIADEVWVRDGGLPQQPKPPLFYTKLFSIDVLLNEYTGKTTAVRDFKRLEVDSLTEIESIDFPPPIGKVEATHGMGMLSTLPWTYEGRIRNMDNKFVRYPGHFPFFVVLKELGFLDIKSIDIGDQSVSPRALSKRLLERHLDRVGARDLYIIDVLMKGIRRGKHVECTYRLLDFFDPKSGLSAMSRLTGFTASIVAQMLATKRVRDVGVLPPELAVPQESFFQELRKRDINISWECQEN